MNIRHALIPLAFVSFALFGAGCASATPSTPSVPPVAVPSAPVEPVTPAPEAVPPTSTAVTTSTAMTAPDTSPLAFPGILPDAQTANKIVRIKTDVGEIVFELLPKEAPKAASNFVYLANRKFYDGLIFHRVESWVIQGGDPTGSGMGGPGYMFAEETPDMSYTRGIVAMAKTPQPNTNGSQFFIMKSDMALDPVYSIFGRVISGMDVVDKVGVGTKMLSITVEDKK